MDFLGFPVDHSVSSSALLAETLKTTRLLLDAAVHRFAEGYLRDMAVQVLDNGRDDDAEYWAMNDLADYHRACARLADDWDRNWSHDSVVICRGPNWDGDRHAKAEMLFGRLSRERRVAMGHVAQLPRLGAVHRQRRVYLGEEGTVGGDRRRRREGR